jgi:hypothetical protein
MKVTTTNQFIVDRHLGRFCGNENLKTLKITRDLRFDFVPKTFISYIFNASIL